VCDGRRRREREAVEAVDRMQNQKQEPHTKMWGIKIIMIKIKKHINNNNENK